MLSIVLFTVPERLPRFLHETKAKVELVTVREVQIIDMLITIFLMIINSTSLTVSTQPSPRFHVEAWLPFRNREMDYKPVSQSCAVRTSGFFGGQHVI